MNYITMNKFLIILAIFFTYTCTVFAADISVLAPVTINNGGQFNVTVNLNTDGVSINSTDVTLSYPKDIVSFKGYKEDGAVKKIWLVSPKDTDGVIHFSGIIPGGIDGVYDPDKSGLQSIPLVQLLFLPKSNGTGEFNITHSEILKNDGMGTELQHSTSNASITISTLQTQISENNNNDTQPPEPFIIEYIQSGLFSKTPSMISFSTTDASSGIEKYQVKTTNNLWKDVVSPLPTPKGLVKRGIIVRALDFNGNSRESGVEIPGFLSPLQLFGIFIVFITCYFAFFVVKRKR